MDKKAHPELYLARSQTMPLSVFARSPEDCVILVPHIHRLHQFQLVSTGPLEFTAIASILGSPTPLLEELYLHCPISHLSVFDNTPPFVGSTPSLRLLQLSRIFSPVVVGVLISTVQDFRFLRLSRPCEELLYVLRQAVHLEKLTLADCSLEFHEDPGLVEPVSLPHLVELRVSAVSSSDYILLLRHLVLPSTVQLMYEVDVWQGFHHPFVLSPDELERSVPRLRCLYIATMINADDASLSDVILTGYPEPQSKRYSLYTALRRCAPHDLANLTRIYPLDTVTEVSIIDEPHPAQQNTGRYTDALASATAICTLNLYCHLYPETLLQLLTVLECRPDLPVLCPVLETLVLYTNWNSSAKVLATLERVASTRLARGIPLKRVILANVSDTNTLDGERMDTIRTLVGELALG